MGKVTDKENKTSTKKNGLESMGSRIRKIRKEKEWTQEKLGELTFISREQINYYETGERRPTIENLVLIADQLNVSADYLLGRIKSRKMSNVVISEKTGLSDKAITKLSKFVKKDSYQLDALYGERFNYQDFATIINAIIEDVEFESFIYFIRAYLNAIKQEKLKEKIEYNSNLDIYGDLLFRDEDGKLKYDTNNGLYYSLKNKCNSSDIYNFNADKIYDRIFNRLEKELGDEFSKRWVLSEDKTKILKVCRDGSEKKSLLKKYNGISEEELKKSKKKK